MAEEQKPRSKQVTMVLSAEDYSRLRKIYEESTCQTFSQFLRETAFHRPIRIKYRNQSIEDFLVVAVDIKNDLEALLRTAGQASADTEIAVISRKVDEIKTVMHQIYQQCTLLSPPPSASGTNSGTTNAK
ncbi:MAG TPA: hypothetical protein VKQ52_05315 [Puia sp.]|nr:hypothetical protein [Puia sp.]